MAQKENMKTSPAALPALRDKFTDKTETPKKTKCGERFKFDVKSKPRN